MSKLFLHSHPVSSYAQKARIALRAKNIAFDFATPEGLGTGQKVKGLSDANPRVEVPALEDGDFKIFDSKIILQYLEEQYPEHPLLPKDPKARAEARMIEEVCDTQYEAVNWGLGEVKFMERATGDLAEKLVNEAKGQIQTLHSWLELQLGSKDFFNGSSFGFADVCVAPYVNRAFYFDLGPAEGSALQKWHARVKEVPSVKQTYAEMHEAMGRFQAMKDAFKPGTGFRREYRDHRLEWMVKSGGLSVVNKGIEENTVRFGWPGGI